MVFSSITFLVYFLPFFLLGYYLVPDRFKNRWLVLGSLLFYSWGAPKFLPAVIVSCLIDFICALNYKKKYGKFWFVFSIVSNVLMLVYFKYANFFAENINSLTEILGGNRFQWSAIILPIGISFLTFQKISYLTDVYRGDCEPQRNFTNYLLFIILFPHSIAGPIIRYKEISEQLVNRFKFITPDYIILGLTQFIIGLSKKVLLSNTLGEQANSIFNLNLNELDFTKSWIGILSYTFQIYLDFSGYSDMAIGLGKMMGFRIPVNFNFPYTSKSITEFWKRWHITLGNWMKDYLYIPLGGNKVTINRTYINLLVVFILSGFWHGASWSFIIWGAYHGSFLIIERLSLSKILKRIHPSISVTYTFLVVMIGWVFFRSAEYNDAILFIRKMFDFGRIDFAFLSTLNNRYYFVLITAFVFSFQSEKIQLQLNAVYEKQITIKGFIWITYFALLLLYLLNLGELFATGFNPFIYFKF